MIPCLGQWVKGSGMAVAAVSQIQSLAWEFPYAVGVALKRKNKSSQLYEIGSVSMLILHMKNL